MKLTSSGLTFVAAMTRSPSFSRSSSSRITTIAPARIAATMVSIESRPDQTLSVACVTMSLEELEVDAGFGMHGQQPLEVTGQHVGLNINSRATSVLADYRNG